MSDLLRQIDSIALFRGVLKKEPFLSLIDFLRKRENGASTEELIDSYSNFVSVLYGLRTDADLSAAVWDALIDDMNPFLKHRIDSIIDPEGTTKMSTLINLTAQRELDLLTNIGKYSSTDFKAEMYYDGYLPDFRSSGIDIAERYMRTINDLGKKGYGIYSRYRMFKIENCRIVPVKHPDPISVEDLFCYEMQRNKVVDNMRAFLAGKPAADCLLYGVAGTGKSSTVKAAARMFEEDGLRLVELPKSEIDNLATVIDMLSHIPMKFVLFIDDISFEATDDRIGALKSVLEGAASGGRKNIIICVTSNRRHMIKETFSDRQNEIHQADTIAEQMSLSERFGLRVLYEKPNKQDFLTIVKRIAERRGLKIDEGELEEGAERFALRGGGRSARLARQYVDSLDR